MLLMIMWEPLSFESQLLNSMFNVVCCACLPGILPSKGEKVEICLADYIPFTYTALFMYLHRCLKQLAIGSY